MWKTPADLLSILSILLAVRLPMLARITSSSPDLDVTGDLDATSSSLQSNLSPTQFDYLFGPKQAITQTVPVS